MKLKQSGVEVTYRFRNTRNKILWFHPAHGHNFLPLFYFMRCNPQYYFNTLKPPIWWSFLEFVPLKIKKNVWMVAYMCLSFKSIQCDWMSTERTLYNIWNSDFSEQSLSIQCTFRNVSVDWMENFHPVIEDFLPC